MSGGRIGRKLQTGCPKIGFKRSLSFHSFLIGMFSGKVTRQGKIFSMGHRIMISFCIVIL